MEKPRMPKRAKASKAIKATTANGGSKSKAVYERQLAARVEKEKQKDADFKKAMEQYKKDLHAFEAQQKRIDGLKGYKPLKADDVKPKKK